MELRDYLRVIRRNRFVLAFLVLLGIAAGAGYALLQTPMYEATAETYISTQTAQSASDLSQGSAYTVQVVENYAHVARTRFVLAPVIESLGLPMTVNQLKKRVAAEPAPNTSVLEITASDPDPARAKAIADAVAARLSTAVGVLSPESQTGTSLVKVTEVDPATQPTSPSSPNLMLILPIGALAGLALALVIAVAREALDTRVREVADLTSTVGEPLLGEVLLDAGLAARPLVMHDRPIGVEAEAFRSIRTNLQFLELAGGSKAFVITSSLPGEGKSTTAANLAIALASANERVLLVDADLRRPRMADYFGIDGGLGLTDVLIGRASVEDAMQNSSEENLFLLPSGAVPPNPTELLQSNAMIALLELLEERFDVVLFDTPPLLPVSDAAILARRTGGAIVAAALGRVRRPQILGALEVLRHVDAPVLGIVATFVPKRRREAYEYTPALESKKSGAATGAGRQKRRPGSAPADSRA